MSAPGADDVRRVGAAPGGDTPDGTVPRLPDFVIIGTMKSGSTTLYRWLEQHPGCVLPAVKEPNFFSSTWERGLSWYTDLFAGIPAGLRTGEASVAYTDPCEAATAARRLKEVAPATRLVCILRHPIARLRSHYRHEVQRGRERRPFRDAVARPDNPYVSRSCYATCLSPWVEEFGPPSLCVIRLEDLVGDDGATWSRVLQHLRLAPVDRPRQAFNVTAGKASFTRPMLWLWERGLARGSDRLPRPVRRAARGVLLRSGGRSARLRRQSEEPLPEAMASRIWRDVCALPALTGDDRLRW